MKNVILNYFSAAGTLFLIILSLVLTSSCTGKSKWETVSTQTKLMDDSSSPTVVSFANRDKGLMLFQNFVYLTNDGGNSWTSNKLDTPPCLSGIDIIDDETFAIGCDCSNAKISTDGGSTWQKLDIVNTNILSFADKADGWLATPFTLFHYNGSITAKIERPADAGKTSTISYIGGASGYLLNEKGELFYTADNGTSWNKSAELAAVNSELMFSNKTASLRFTDTKHGCIAAFDKKAAKYSIYETADGGGSWKLLTSVDSALGVATMTKDTSYLTIMPYTGAEKLLVFKNSSLAMR